MSHTSTRLALCIFLLVFHFCLTAKAEGMESISVIPFENHTGNADMSWLTPALYDTLLHQLSTLTGLILIDHKQKAISKNNPVQPLEYLKSIDAMLVGEYLKVGENLEIHVRLVQINTDAEKVLISIKQTGNLEEIFHLQDHLANELIDRIRPFLKSSKEPTPIKPFGLMVGGCQRYGKAIRLSVRLVEEQQGHVLNSIQLTSSLDQLAYSTTQLALHWLKQLHIPISQDRVNQLKTLWNVKMSAENGYEAF